MTEREKLDALYSSPGGGPTYSRRSLDYCYNPLLDYGATQTQRIELAAQPDDAKTAQGKLDAVTQVLADFFFDGDKETALATIQAQATFRDLEIQTADAFCLCAMPDRRPGEIVKW